jgi:hypothetical protein
MCLIKATARVLSLREDSAGRRNLVVEDDIEEGAVDV